MNTPGLLENTAKKPSLPIIFSVALVVFVIFGIVYTIAVLLGQVADRQKIDTSNLALILLVLLAVLVLSRPRVLAQVSLVEILGMKVQLSRVIETQAVQQRQLQDISLILPLLIPASERKHLTELGNNQRNVYHGCDSLVRELRRLRSVGLITGEAIGRLQHVTEFILSDHVKLSELGRRWVERINEIE